MARGNKHSLDERWDVSVARWQWSLALLALAAGVIAAYSNSLHVPFLLDDSGAIVENSSLRPPFDIGTLWRPPVTGTTAGRPFLNLSFAGNYAVSGLKVESYHLVNIALHVCSGLLLMGLVRGTLDSARLRSRFHTDAHLIAFIVGALWALHPLLSQSVTYVSQRAESLMGTCAFLVLYLFMRSMESTPRYVWLAGSIAACFCGMATKEVMVTIPILVLLYDRAFFSNSFGTALRRRPAYYAALFSAWGFLAWLMVNSRLAERGVGFASGVSAATYGLVQLRAVATYVKLAFWPSPLVFDYGIEVMHEPVRFAGLLVIVMVVAVASILWSWRRHIGVGFLCASFFLLIAPSSSVIPVILQPMAESRMYLPLSSLIALVTLGAYAAGGRRALFGLGLVALLFAGLTYRRNQDYETALRLWTETVAIMPNSSRAQLSLADALVDAKRQEEALSHYEAALRLRPDYGEAHNNLAILLGNVPGKELEALDHLVRAAALLPTYAEVRYNLANALARTPERLPEAIRLLESAVRLKPDYFEARNNLANLLAQTPGREGEVLSQFEAAARLRPDNIALRYNLGMAYGRAGRRSDAIKEFRSVLALEPTFTLAREQLDRLQGP